MDKAKINKKSLNIVSNDDISNDLELINEHTIQPLTADEVYCFKVILCDNDVDRAYDKMSDEFLEQFAEASKGLTGLKDHDWDSDNQLARLYDTEVVLDESTLTKLGEARKYVLGKAYTLSRYYDYVDKINAGLLKESSISFDSEGDTCSICGAITEKSYDKAICPNGHIMGEEYDGKLCYNIINKLKDTYEWSLVAVPCQRGSGIKNKNIDKEETSIMKKSIFLFEKLINSKAFKGLDEETQATLRDVVEGEADTDLSEEDIKELISENAELKETVSNLEAKLKEAECGRTMDKIESIVEKAVDELNPLTPTVKENILRDINLDALKMEDGQIAGLDDVLNGIKEKYDGLFAKADDAEGKEPDTDDEDKESGDEEDKDKEEVVKKSVKNKSGIRFSAGTNEKSADRVVRNGRTFK